MAQAQTEAKPIVTRNQAVVWLRQMMLIRRFEERAEMLYQKEQDRRVLPSVQRPGAGCGRVDRRPPGRRLRDHRLPRPRPRPGPGDGRRAGMAELLGKATGCSRGKGGSMHFFDVEKGFLGGHAIVGSHIPLAAGVAFAIKYRGEDRVCLCYFGDGAMNQGGVHEALNMASLWKLPVIYVVENNMYAMGTQLHRHSWTTDLTSAAARPTASPAFRSTATTSS